MTKSAIGVDLGPRGVRMVVVDADGRVSARADRRATAGGIARAAKAAAHAIAKAAGPGPLPARACAVDMNDEDVRAALEAMSGTARVQADVVGTGIAAATAETWIGAARGTANVVALVIGDQISAGILIGGRPYTGAHGMAGAAAWLALNPVERQDYRRSGCLDAEVSSHGVARRLVWRIEAGDRSSVLEKAGGNLDAITAEHVYDGARARDGVAISVVRDTAKYIGMAVANLLITVDPDLVVLCGEVSRAADLLLEPVRQECARRLPHGLADTFRLECSTLGDEVAAIGAARLALP
jgi:glucokinase